MNDDELKLFLSTCSDGHWKYKINSCTCEVGGDKQKFKDIVESFDDERMHSICVHCEIKVSPETFERDKYIKIRSLINTDCPFHKFPLQKRVKSIKCWFEPKCRINK